MGSFKDKIGQKFGRLRVLHLYSLSPTMWWCVCSPEQQGCGKEKPVRNTTLVSGGAQSCGCLQRERAKENSIRSRKRPYESLFNFIGRNAKERGHEFILSYEEFLEFVGIAECHYCGTAVQWQMHFDKAGASTPRYNLDRKDNAEGYKKSNLVVCCKRCNYGKGGGFTYEEWVELGKVIRKMRGLGATA